MDKHNRVTLLDRVNDPADLRGMNMEELNKSPTNCGAT